MQHEDGSTTDALEPALIFYPLPYHHRLPVPEGAAADLICANVQFREASRNPFVLALPPYLLVSLHELESMGEVVYLLFSDASKESLGQRFIMDRLCDILVFQVIRHAMNTGQLKTEVGDPCRTFRLRCCKGSGGGSRLGDAPVIYQGID